MVGEVFAGISAFNGMLGAARALKDLNDAVVRNQASIDLQGQIMAAQESYAKLLEKVRELEATVASFADWESTKKRYELKDVGAAIFAYALRDGVDPPEPAHSICPDCYQQKRASILQRHEYDAGTAIALVCQVCDWHGYIHGQVPPNNPRRRR